MGQFKPMVKMMTTEPTVELKLKKGGAVKMKKGGSTTKAKKMAMGGGAMDMMAGTPALLGRPAVNAPVRTPMKPSMAMRRKAMMAKPAITPSGPSMGMPAMKKGGKMMMEGGKSDMAQDKAMIKKAFKQHDMQEHKGGKGTSLKLRKGGMMNCATGGSIPSEESWDNYPTTMMHQAKPDHSKAKTGDVKNGNAGGYKRGGKTKKFATGGVANANGGGYKRGGYATGGDIPEEETYGSYDTTMVHQASKRNPSVGTGGVRNGNAGGFKMGGKSSKKAYATGGIVDTGRPVAMPQGNKPVPSSVKISQLAGTYKKGGRATPAEARLLKYNASENAMSMRDAKTQSNLKYGSPKRMASGGQPMEDMSNGAYDAHYANEKAENEAMRNMILDPLKSLGQHVMRSFDPEGYFKGDERKKLFESQSRNYLADRIKADRAAKGQGAVTQTEKSVTVTPAGKKRGGRAC